MAESRKTFNIKSDQPGEVKIADEVVAIIAGLATTEVEGVSSMAGNITNEIVSRLGMKSLSKGIQVEVSDNEVRVVLQSILHTDTVSRMCLQRFRKKLRQRSRA